MTDFKKSSKSGSKNQEEKTCSTQDLGAGHVWYIRRNGWRDRTQEEKKSDAHNLVNILLGLERETDPNGRNPTAKDKDIKASDALQFAGMLVERLAGWAIDHQIGLAIEGLSYGGRGLHGFNKDDLYKKAKKEVDSHRHEAAGSVAYLPTFKTQEDPSPTYVDLSPEMEQRVMANLLLMNPGGFPQALSGRFHQALKALEHGGVRDEVRPQKSRQQASAKNTLKLEALRYIAFQCGKGEKKDAAEARVAAAFHRTPGAIEKWETRIPDALGELDVKRTLAFAKNDGIRAAHAEKEKVRLIESPDCPEYAMAQFDVQRYEIEYGDDALSELARRHDAVERKGSA